MTSRSEFSAGQMTLIETALKHVDYAETMMADGDGFPATWIMTHREDGEDVTSLIATPFQGDSMEDVNKAKRYVAMMITCMLMAKQATQLVFVTEVWTAQADRRDYPDPSEFRNSLPESLADHDKSVEKLMIISMSRDDEVTLLYDINRQDGVSLGEPDIIAEPTSGLFSKDLFPSLNDMTEENIAMAKQTIAQLDNLVEVD